MSDNEKGMAHFRRFRVASVRLALGAMALLAAAGFFYDPVTAQGVLLGGLGGIIGFWIMAVRLEKLAMIGKGKVKFAVLTWTYLRFALYGVVLFRAYTLDRESYHGLLGAVAGLFIIRFVMVFLGLTGFDVARNESKSGGDQPE